MSRRKSRIAGKALPRQSHIIPICTSCRTKEHMRRNEKNEWFCLKCADEWLGEFVRAKAGNRTASGIELPVGVTDPAKENPSFRDVYPNRASRRRAQRLSR